MISCSSRVQIIDAEGSTFHFRGSCAGEAAQWISSFQAAAAVHAAELAHQEAMQTLDDATVGLLERLTADDPSRPELREVEAVLHMCANAGARLSQLVVTWFVGRLVVALAVEAPLPAVAGATSSSRHRE